MKDNKLPFGSEFSPSQIELPELISFCMENSGNKETLENVILSRYFSSHAEGSLSNKKKLAMNCRLGLKSYGIIDEKSVITELGNSLFSLINDEEKLYKEFAKHILLNLNGMGFVQCLRDMAVALEEINLTTLRLALAERHIHYPSGGKHPSIMRLWLAKAGVIIGNRWQVDNEKINDILGTDDSIEALRKLTTIQRDFLLALINSGVSSPQPASQVVKIASATFGTRFPEKSLPKEVLNGLVDNGFIKITKTTEGRGAKPFLVEPTELVTKEIIIPFMKQIEEQTDQKLTKLLTKSLGEILIEIKSNDKYKSGLALEALAFKLLRILGMDYLATRLRAESTGGSEVDLLFHSTRLVYSRWQVQCKNTDKVHLDQVAKEIGLVQITYSNVIVIISTGTISDSARTLANKTMKQTNLCIVFIDGKDIEKISFDPSLIIDAFDREAKATMLLKKIEL